MAWLRTPQIFSFGVIVLEIKFFVSPIIQTQLADQFGDLRLFIFVETWCSVFLRGNLYEDPATFFDLCAVEGGK